MARLGKLPTVKPQLGGTCLPGRVGSAGQIPTSKEDGVPVLCRYVEDEVNPSGSLGTQCTINLIYNPSSSDEEGSRTSQLGGTGEKCPG